MLSFDKPFAALLLAITTLLLLSVQIAASPVPSPALYTGTSSSLVAAPAPLSFAQLFAREEHHIVRKVLSTAAIIGIVIAGLCFFSFIFLIWCCCCRNKRR
jgi:hypothetical protein